MLCLLYGGYCMKKGMEKYILDAAKGHPLYYVREDKYRNSCNPLNFRISPEPFRIKKEDYEAICKIGKAICSYMDGCVELYNSNLEVKELLDRGKPDEYRNVGLPKYLFLRPDLILTENRFYSL